MTTKVLKLVSDFNIEPLGRYMTTNANAGISIEVAPFGQVYQTLSVTKNESLWGSVIWTQAEKIIPAFSRALDFDEIAVDECMAQVDRFAETILEYAATLQHAFVINWTLPAGYRGYGLLDWRPEFGTANLLARMNLKLAERLADAQNIYVLDAARWLHSGPRADAPKMWYLAKVPYANNVFERAASDLLAAVQAIEGKSRRLIILDLDNTMWGGVVGETGWEGIRLGGHDHVGEAFRDFQRALKAMSNRGIQLAIVSKNDESVALEAIDKHPEMLLRRNDFAGWRINWSDKAANIEALLEDLNLGLASVVFIDDNPAERERVRGALPEVLVPEWPLDPTSYVSALRALNCFDAAAISKEDRSRTAMYVAERERRATKANVTSMTEWLADLDTRLAVSGITKSNIARVVQLFNKTNQLNLSTRRLSEKEILDWAAADNHSMLAISASDRFGDMGLVGVVGTEASGAKGRLIDFVLSCRVMGRKVEETLIHLATVELNRMGAVTMEARYVPTARNRPTLDVFRASGLTEISENVFESECITGIAKPEAISVEFVNQ